MAAGACRAKVLICAASARWNASRASRAPLVVAQDRPRRLSSQRHSAMPVDVPTDPRPTPSKTALVARRAVVAFLLAGAAATSAQRVVPAEIDGRIDGHPARFVASGDDLLLSVAEAERLGIPYRDGKRIEIGGTPLWLVTLGSVTVDRKTRLAAPAGVVPSIAGYVAALRSNPAQALARSRETRAEIQGQTVRGYDLGAGGLLLAPEEADRIGLRYLEGRRADVGSTTAWVVEAPVKLGTAATAPLPVVVAEPAAYFRDLLATLAVPPR
ncbi:MAG: hypothetical protein ABI364_06790 [Caldimonas sp.]